MSKIPTVDEAEDLLLWAEKQNPGPWVKHSRTTARAAKTIALQCGIDENIAYVSGLLHDIGRCEGIRELHHVISGYNLMNGKGYTHNARICLTHSFPYKSIASYSGKNDCTNDEIREIQTKLEEYEYDDYDKLIQVCDAICTANGVCIMEVRLIEVARRYNTLNKDIVNKWNAFFDLKKYFDTKCGMNIYGLFREEIFDLLTANTK